MKRWQSELEGSAAPPRMRDGPSGFSLWRCYVFSVLSVFYVQLADQTNKGSAGTPRSMLKDERAITKERVADILSTMPKKIRGRQSCHGMPH